MSMRGTLLIGMVIVGAAAYVWLEASGDVPATSINVARRSNSEQPQAAPIVTPETPSRAKRSVKEAASASSERAVSERGQVPGTWAAVSIADAEDFPAPRSATSSLHGKRLSSPRPGDDVARAQLVRDIQYELRRVGCYDGELNGWWSSNTKRAMKSFTDRVNATLPIDEADYILLSLVQGHKGLACGKACPTGQLAAADGRCLPRAIVAQRKSGTQKPGTSVSETATATSASQQTPTAAHEPLPGRMAVGAPIAGGSERAEIALEEARRHQEAVLEDRRLRLDAERRARLGSVDAANAAEDARRREAVAALEAQRPKSAHEASQTDVSKTSGSTAGLALPASAATALAGQPVDPNAPPADMRRRERSAGPYRSPNRAYARKGSTREVFATVTRSAP